MSLRSLFLPLLGMALLAALPAFAQAPPSCAPLSPPAASVKMAPSYGRLPLPFEPNVGQTDRRVRFLTHASGGTLFLTDTEAVLALPQRDKKATPDRKSLDPSAQLRDKEPAPTRYSILRMKLTGAHKPVATLGLDKLPGIVNYFRGNDPKQWHTNIPTYRKARFAGVYRGVDMVYYGAQDGRLEYDFVVKPGADPRQIKLAFSGATGMRVTSAGDLALQTEAGEVVWHRPVTYQEENGRRQMVACDYRVEREYGMPAVRFALARYDANKPLIIDPTLQYSTYLGGSNFNLSNGITVDSSGNAYVTGRAASTDFPVTPGAFQTTSGGNQDAFVTKLNASGSTLLYSTYLGGSTNDVGYGIAVDSSGSAYVTGRANSTDFPVTAGAFQTVSNAPAGYRNAFVTKLDASGSALVYSTYLGGSGSTSNFNAGDYGYGIAVDSSGSAYVTGQASSTDFPVTPGAFQTTSGGGSGNNAFVTKLNASGSALVYSTFLGGSTNSYLADYGRAIMVDSSSNAYVTGTASSTNFPVTPGALQTTKMGKSYIPNVFVTKLNASGSALIYSTYLGGSGNDTNFVAGDTGYGIAVDGSGNAYVAGQTYSTDFPVTPGAYQTVNKSAGTPPSNAFVTKLNASGSALIYSTFLGGSGDTNSFFDNGTVGRSIALDGSGNAYVTGYTISTDFPVTPGAFQTTSGGNQDAFVTKLNASGSTLLYSTYLGGSTNDDGLGIALDGSGNAYVTGYTGSSDFPITPGAFQTTFAGGANGANAFVSKFLFEQANPVPRLTGLSPSSAPANSTAMTIIVTGANFLATTAVNVNGTARATTYVDAAHLNVTLTTADLKTPGSLVLTATNPAPGGGVSNAQVFLVTQSGASLRFVNLRLSRLDATHVNLLFAVSNPGTKEANGVQVLSGSVNANGTTTAISGLPLSIGTVAAGTTSATATLPLGNLTAGATVFVSLKGTSAAGGTFTTTYRFVVP